MEHRRHPFAPGWGRHRAVPQQSLPAGSWVLHQPWAWSLPCLSFLQSRGVGVFSGVQEVSFPFPPAWSPPQLFVSIGRTWVGIAVFPWRLCRWCRACPWAPKRNLARLNVVCSEQGYVQEHLRENSNILLRNMEFSWISSQCVSHLFAVPVHLGISQWRKLWNEDLHDAFCAFSGKP